MKLYLQVTLVIVSHMVLVSGLQCGSQCAACWKDDTPGVDIKVTCGYDGWCGETCPQGYHDLHCAKWARCT